MRRGAGVENLEKKQRHRFFRERAHARREFIKNDAERPNVGTSIHCFRVANLLG